MEESHSSLSYHGWGVHGKLYKITSQIKLLTTSEATLRYWALNRVVSAAEGASKHRATMLHSKSRAQWFRQGRSDKRLGFFLPVLCQLGSFLFKYQCGLE